MQKSLFDRSIYTMWLRRYWPGAALMAMVFLFIALSCGNSVDNTLRYGTGPITAEQLSVFISSSDISFLECLFAAGAALVACVLCFNYMQSPSSAVMIHSLPQRRHTLYFSVCAAGLTLVLVPILFSSATLAIIMASKGYFSLQAILLYLLSMSGTAVFSFAFTAIIGTLTGHSIAQALFTVIALAGPLVVEMILYTYLARNLFGFSPYGTTPIFALLNPIYHMAIYLDAVTNALIIGDAPAPVLTPIVILLVGLGLIVAGALIYRRRKTEVAGEVAGARVMRPIFRYSMALICAVVLGTIFRSLIPGSSSIAVDLVFGILGGLLGYFGTEMLTRRSLQVFDKAKGAVVFTVLFAAVMLSLYFDIFGYGRYQLNQDAVEFLIIDTPSSRAYSAMEGGALNRGDVLEDLNLTDEDGYLELVAQDLAGDMPDSIARQIMEQDNTVMKDGTLTEGVLLQNMLAQRASKLVESNRQDMRSMAAYSEDGTPNYRYYYVNMTAKMKDGKVVSRRYTFLLENGDEPELMSQYELVTHNTQKGQAMNVRNMAAYANSLALNFHFPNQESSSWTLNQGQWDGFFEAYVQDYEEQRDMEVEQDPYSGTTTYIDATLSFPGDRAEYFVIPLTYTNTNILNWLTDEGILAMGVLTSYA